MPELPEVETIRRQLNSEYAGKTVENVTVFTPSVLKNCSAGKFRSLLQRRKLERIERRGKFLIFFFEGVYVVVHLGMSGIFVKERRFSNYPGHIHIRFRFVSGKKLYYQDVRRFGKIWLYKSKPKFPDLGLEPLDENFTLNKFSKLINLKRQNVKSFLMDQRIIAGIGNIYANEILFRAGISPLRRTESLRAEEIAALFKAIPTVLRSALERFGTTYRAYQTVSGDSGENQMFLQVYHREAQPCTVCATPIRKVIIGNRSTFYCPKCQK